MGVEQYNVKIVKQVGFYNIGTITSAQAALGVLARDSATVDALAAAKKILIPLVGDPEAYLLRFRSDGSENDTNILQLYLGDDNDHYEYIGQLSVNQGQQIDAGSIFFGDVVTPANENTFFAGVEDTTTNYIGKYFFKVHGYKNLLIVASTLATTTLYVDGKRANV
jgi:hypothetical protein